tara:strand:+ start:489 stop:899 length:411 start_codon:yes stop_codon:yes gene_type:complete
MARRKNTKRVDPRWFMNEKTETINEAWDSAGNWKSRYSNRQDVEPETDEARKHRREKEERMRRAREDAGYPPEKSKYFEEGESEPDTAIAEQGGSSDLLLDLAGEVAVLASHADEQMRNALLNLQGQLEMIASRLR